MGPMMGQFNGVPQFQTPYANVNPYAPAYVPQNKPDTGINWVQGIEGAKAWQLPPNSNVILLDSETTGDAVRFYIKTSDNIGMCNLRVFDGVEVTGQSAQPMAIDMSAYVTRNELNQILNSLGGQGNAKQSVSTAKSKSNSNAE